MTKTIPTVLALLLLTSSLAHATVRNYFAPGVDGQRLDSCLTGERDCGKPAADAFCQAQGYENAILFQREPGILTRRLHSTERCEGAACMSFRQIKCYTPKGDLAAAAQN